MKRTGKIFVTILIVLALLLPPTALVALAFTIPPQYDSTFVGALDEKFERLNSIQDDKIVVVGGSSVAFGLDSRMLEEYTGMPVVNFGLYAALGTKIMLDLSLSGIEDGDIVILAPEMNKETLSLFFNADTAWRAVESDFSMLKYIGSDNRAAMAGALWGYTVDKISAAVSGGIKTEEGVYLSEHFNEYGDFTGYPRTENVMQGYYDPNTEIISDPDMLGEEFFAFAEYLNEYIKKCEDRGACVYFSFSPMNSLAVNTDDETLAKLYDFLDEHISCEIISDPGDYILDPGYFFDTNFHLNDTGVYVRTLKLASDVRLAAGIFTGLLPTEIPSPPELPGFDTVYDGYDENSVYFTYELRPDGTYAITGLSELGRTMTELSIPLCYDGIRVTSVCEGAFSGSVLERLTVTEDSYLSIFENGAFLGASELRALIIRKPSGDDIAPPATFAGVNRDFTVYVPEGSDFSYHYYWSERGLVFETID